MKNLFKKSDYLGVLLTPVEASVISTILYRITIGEKEMTRYSTNEQKLIRQLKDDFQKQSTNNLSQNIDKTI